VQVKIQDPDERGVGEIVVKGPMVMRGYYKMPEETRAAFTEDGWFKTATSAIWTTEIPLPHGRAKNMIVTEGGKNVYPRKSKTNPAVRRDRPDTGEGLRGGQELKVEGIEALVFPNLELFKTPTASRSRRPKSYPGSKPSYRKSISGSCPTSA
jgi:long-chain acyl-CoA synthetase